MEPAQGAEKYTNQFNHLPSWQNMIHIDSLLSKDGTSLQHKGHLYTIQPKKKQSQSFVHLPKYNSYWQAAVNIFIPQCISMPQVMSTNDTDYNWHIKQLYYLFNQSFGVHIKSLRWQYTKIYYAIIKLHKLIIPPAAL